IEINLVAVRRDGRTRKEIVGARCPVPLGHASPAVRAGDLVFLSGLCAATGDGVIPAARVDRGFPYASSSIRAQTESILEQADALCRAAGTALGAVARQQLFYTDLSEFDASFRSIASRFGDGLPATSVVRVPAMAIPGCGVTMDMWAVTGEAFPPRDISFGSVGRAYSSPRRRPAVLIGVSIPYGFHDWRKRCSPLCDAL